MTPPTAPEAPAPYHGTMKLHYYRDAWGNFGDDLNPWLWPRLLPGHFDRRGDELVLGIGTVLNHRAPRAPVKQVFGAGAG